MNCAASTWSGSSRLGSFFFWAKEVRATEATRASRSKRRMEASDLFIPLLTGRSCGYFRDPHRLAIELVKVIQAALLLHAVAPAAVTARTQVALHDLADAAVLKLNVVAELKRLFRHVRLEHIFRKEPQEDGDALLRPERQDDVEAHIVGVTVQHPVGINPVVLGAKVAGRIRIPTRGCPTLTALGTVGTLGRTDRRVLQRVPREQFNLVSVVIQLPVQARMH